ncbi:MAG: thiamine pyrophosphate-binding protein, partial [Siphonobacter sp.]
MILQPVLDLVELCVRKGIRYAVISPGSRSAALTLAFARHSEIETKVIPDERVAGYVALGMAQQLRSSVAVVCTSGTAALNLAPAVAEAYFLKVPLLILTADRPSEWIQQQDGQMIYQQDVFGKHVKQSHQLPADYPHPDAAWYMERLVNQVISIAESQPQGPVHLNLPIREPFYPTTEEVFEFGRPKVISVWKGEPILTTNQWADLMQ